MGDDNTAFAGSRVNIPGKGLLNGHREAGIESTLNAIIPVSRVEIAIMCIQNRLVVTQEL